MPMLPINWSELDQKYWINDVDGDVLWFDNSLDAKEAQLKVMLKEAVLDDRERVERELIMAELMNIDHVSTEWLEGFRFAMERIQAVWKENT